MYRRYFAFAASILAAGSLLVAGLVNPVAAQDKTVRVALSWIPNVEYGGLWLAMERGYFKQEGLKIEYQPGGPNAPKSLVSLAAGKADIAYGVWLPFLDAVGRGNDFVIVAATFPVSPLGVISLAGNPIRKPADLVGKKILAQGVAERSAIDAVLALNNLPKKWEFVPAGYSPEPLLAKQGHGYTAFGTNQAVALELRGMKRGKDFYFASFDSLGFKQYASAVFTSHKFLQNDRATVVKFLRALTRGWQDNEKDLTVAPKLAVNKYGADLGLNLKQQLRQNELQIKMMRNPDKPQQPILMLDRDTIAKMYAAAQATGRKNIPPVEKIADFGVMEEARKGIK